MGLVGPPGGQGQAGPLLSTSGRGRVENPLEPLLEEFSNLQPADGFENPAVWEASLVLTLTPPSPTLGWASLGTLCAKFSFEFPYSLNASSGEH